jgi:hypothetical protein
VYHGSSHQFLDDPHHKVLQVVELKALNLEDRNARKAMAKTASPELLMSSKVLTSNDTCSATSLLIIQTAKRNTRKAGQREQLSALWFVPDANGHVVAVAQSLGI